MKRSPLTLAAALVFSATPALAQPAPSLAGHWVFATVEATVNQCVIRGTAALTPSGADRFRVALTTHEVCKTGSEWRSVQNCVATRSGAAVEVDCEIVRADPDNYLDDDFTLQVRGADLMEGSLNSTWEAPVRWRRAAPELVS